MSEEVNYSPRGFRQEPYFAEDAANPGNHDSNETAAAVRLEFDPRDQAFGAVSGLGAAESEHISVEHENTPVNSRAWHTFQRELLEEKTAQGLTQDNSITEKDGIHMHSGTTSQETSNANGNLPEAVIAYANFTIEPDPLPPMLPMGETWMRATGPSDRNMQQQYQPPPQPDDQAETLSQMGYFPYSQNPLVAPYEQARFIQHDPATHCAPPYGTGSRSDQTVAASVEPLQHTQQWNPQETPTAYLQPPGPNFFPTNSLLPRMSAAIPPGQWNGGASFPLAPASPNFLSKIDSTTAIPGIQEQQQYQHRNHQQQHVAALQSGVSYWGTDYHVRESNRAPTSMPSSMNATAMCSLEASTTKITRGSSSPAAKKRKVRDKDKPKKPLSAYNIFFKEERARMVAELLQEKVRESGDSPSSATAAGDPTISNPARVDKTSNQSSDETCVARTEQTSAVSVKSENTSDETKRQRKRVRIGIGFKKLASEIGKRWKRIDSNRLQEYTRRAEIDKRRYDREMAIYAVKQREQLSETRAQLESTVSEETKRRYFDS